MSLFFNTQIVSDNKSVVESFGDFCFTPLRFLFKGRDIRIINGRVVRNERTFPSRLYSRTFGAKVLAASALSISIIFGIIAKSFACLTSSYRNNRRLAHLHVSLNKSHLRLEELAFEIEQDLKKNNIMESKDFINKVDTFMQLANIETSLFFKTLKLEGQNDLNKMASILEDQHGIERTYGHKIQNKFIHYSDGGYCYKFFYSSLTSIYHQIRNYAFREGKISAFFLRQSKQSSWRNQYNKLCDRIEPLRKKLRDTRFSKWTKNDEIPTKILYGDKKPSFFGFTFLFNGSLHPIPYLFYNVHSVTERIRKKYKQDF